MDSLCKKIAAHLGVAAPGRGEPNSRLRTRLMIAEFAVGAPPKVKQPSSQQPRWPTANTKELADPRGDEFLLTYAWRKLRMQVLKRDGARCACCGATPADGVRMNVDHIKPRRLYPQLALDATNLQVLCDPCNHGKGNWDETDWRAGTIDHPGTVN